MFLYGLIQVISITYIVKVNVIKLVQNALTIRLWWKSILPSLNERLLEKRKRGRISATCQIEECEDNINSVLVP